MIDVPIGILATLLESYRACEASVKVVNIVMHIYHAGLCARLDDRASIRVTKDELESLLYHADLACGEKLSVPVPYANLRELRSILNGLNPGNFEMSPITYQYELRRR